ncbi:hypothetical protein SDC9_71033 [bioreactor metagenome]|uniref:Uncharacterized protein n=1 Tax=bioreactor metagenome TaxID=1076179 RepID=A0A644Y7V4_9ZZZZ
MPIEDGIPDLIEHKRAVQFLEDFRRAERRFRVVIRNARVKRASALDRRVEGEHALLQRRLGVHAMMVKDIHIRQPHALQALVQAREHVFSAAVVAVGPRPHQITRLSTDDQLVAVLRHLLAEDTPEIRFRGARLGAVVIGEVKVRHSLVERGKAHPLHVFVIVVRAKVMPKPQ